MSISCLGITLERRDCIEVRADRSEQTAWLAIKVDGAQCEIRIGRTHMEAPRDKIPAVLGGLERVAVEDAACERAEIAAERAADAAVRAFVEATLVADHAADRLVYATRQADDALNKVPDDDRPTALATSL